MPSRATQAKLLEQRIAENTAAQGVDLTAWIFERLDLNPGARVLELCCGTGAQTLRFLEVLGDPGFVAALDISREALDAIAKKTGSQTARSLTLVEGNLDDFGPALRSSGLRPGGFDLVFCAYGLYYSTDPLATLSEARSWLNPRGRIVVVGPFGPNNGQLFDLVRASGVVLAPAVIDSSQHFMLRTVLPWAAVNFETVGLSSMVNPVRWEEPERVLSYWEHTTFYDPEKRPVFEKLLRSHFEKVGQFVNEKWVMMAEMSHARF